MDNKVHSYEAISFLCLYGLYVFTLTRNQQFLNFLTQVRNWISKDSEGKHVIEFTSIDSVDLGNNYKKTNINISA
jgi:hypothetical protein